MSNIKRIFTSCFLMVSVWVSSQSIKLKKGDILVDDVAWIKYQDCGGFDKTCSLLNNSKEELIFLKWITVPGAEPVTKSNPQGNLAYVEIVFLGLNKRIEIQKTQKNIIELIYNSKVINEDGTLNFEKADRIVEKYGTPFSDRLNNTTNGNTIIINNATPKSGVNINIGR